MYIEKNKVVSNLDNDDKQCIEKIIDDLEWLLDQSGEFYTIDTLAKKFYLTNELNHLVRLKKALITYFTLEQIVYVPSDNNENYQFKKERIDKRYGSFISGISRRSYKVATRERKSSASDQFFLNSDVRFLSWNYDMQFELTLKMFFPNVVNSIKRDFNILPNKETRDEVNFIPLKENKFAVVKLNGDAFWSIIDYKNHDNCPTPYDGNLKDDDTLKRYLEQYEKSDLNDSIAPPHLCFNFAWEEDTNFRERYVGYAKNIESALAIARDTDILVIIGYSFPIFNRQIDRRLINEMTRLKKVYIQDSNPSKIESLVRGAFKRLGEKTYPYFPADIHTWKYTVEVEHDSNLNQFTIPFELEL